MDKIYITTDYAKELILNEYNDEGIFDEVTLDAMSNRKLGQVLNFEQKELGTNEHYIVKDFMLVAYRLANGWTDYKKNKSYNTCDIDGAKLWINPGGNLYCDRVHEE